jgi:long-chain fatty acid transport protein
MNRKARRIAACSVAAALAGVAGGASASGFQLMEQNASGLGNAYAGQAASAQDASTIFFNPAGMPKIFSSGTGWMSNAGGMQMVTVLNVIKPSAEFTNTGSTLAPLQTSLGGNGGDGGDWAYIPNGYFAAQVNRQLFVGVGLSTPFGLKTDYDAGWVGRFHALKSDLKTVNVNPSVAWKISDTLTLGGGVNYQFAKATLTNSVNYSAAAFGAGGAGALALAGGPGVEGVATLKADDGAWGWNAGVMIDVTPNTRIGASYRSAVKFKLEGDATFSNRPAVLAAGLPNGPIHADVKMPATASIAVFHKLNPQWDLLADVTWTEWSNIPVLDINRTGGARLTTIPLNWKNTWRAGLGANYHQNSQWTWRAGVAFDETPVPDADRTPRVPDQDRKWIAIGAQYRWSRQLVFDIGYSHIFIKDASVNLCNAAQAAANPAACSGKNNLVGTYSDNTVDIISAQVRHSF